jgi:hypothetical protein
MAQALTREYHVTSYYGLELELLGRGDLGTFTSSKVCVLGRRMMQIESSATVGTRVRS